MKAVLVAGIVAAAAGLLTMWLPEKLWRSWFVRQPRWRNQSSTGALMLFSGLGVLGIGFVLLCAESFTHGLRSNRWADVEATVTATLVKEVMQPRSTNLAFRPQIDYSYQWAGHSYRGGLLSYGSNSSSDPDFARETLEQFPVGKTIRIKVDPSRPDRSVIRPGADGLHWVYALAGLAFVGVGANGLRMLAKDWDGSGEVTSLRRGGGGP